VAKKSAARGAPVRRQAAPGSAPGAPASSAGDQPAPRRPPPVDDSQATTRGYIVIAVTVVIGLIIFYFGVQKPADKVATSTSTLPTNQTVPEEDKNAAPSVPPVDAGTTSTVPPATTVSPAGLKVMVANGVDPTKTIAGPVATTLNGQGYHNTTTVDLTTKSPTSAVYYTGSLEPEAQAVASILHIPAGSVKPMPSPPPTTLNGAQILVVIGQDHT
jgi:hypothetical protein